MTNKEIAGYFNDLANIMDLHKENPFKIKSYRNAYIQLRKLDRPLIEMTEDEVSSLKGIGKAITSKVFEIIETKELQTYNKYKEKTPSGILEMLNIKGFGPSKIRVVWKDLEVENVGELLYACNENRLITLKGFGQKTQEELIEKIHFYYRSRDKFLYASVEEKAEDILKFIQGKFPENKVVIVGELRRKNIIINRIEFLMDEQNIDSLFGKEIILLEKKENKYICKNEEGYPLTLFTCSKEEWGSKLFKYTATRDFITSFLASTKEKDFTNLESEEAIFKKAQLPFILPELRNDSTFVGKDIQELITEKDISGVIHSHTTYSDGVNTIQEMADYAKKLGYQYIGITDHSKSAFYANGLKEEKLKEQWEEIDQLNQKYSDFKIYKGIESDILYDGSLDYDKSILKEFDFIIASIHSQLKMFKEKATERLIKAIENPYTTILGHPTGRLLLSRQGYPIDHKKIIDACAANGVAIELNANPVRLDLDPSWIPYAMEKNVKISINPDAHSTRGIHDIHYGVLAARTGGMTRKFLYHLS